MNNPYDFSDLSDLPEELQERIAPKTRVTEEPPMVQKVVDLVTRAPQSLTLAQIMAVGQRTKLELPTEVTVRAYLGRALADGRIVKDGLRNVYRRPRAAVRQRP